ncbi:hypothetical protein [Bandra megavirus]|uniref:Uncharacterized protein n=1 Tax=Bandra megavirus TaxID=2071566 RepID=A0A2K9V8B9_9VIRU|nr:hypothetical protein [Bandra megavirus]
MSLHLDDRNIYVGDDTGNTSISTNNEIINVDNSDIQNNIYVPHNIIDNNGNRVNNLTELYNLLDTILYDIIHTTTLSTLPKIKYQAQPDKYHDVFHQYRYSGRYGYDYKVIGANALEKYINPKNKYATALNFDIEINETSERIAIFTKELSVKLNSYINYKYGPIRHFIKNILFKYNLIDESCFNHYANTDIPLFRYGFQKLNNDMEILTVFIHLVFRKNLFSNKLFNNSGPINENFNIIFHPIINIYPSDLTYSPVTRNDIKYGTLPQITARLYFNLVSGINVIENDTRLQYLTNYKTYICNSDFGFPFDILSYNKNKRFDIHFAEQIQPGTNFIRQKIIDYYNLYYQDFVPKNNCGDYLKKLKNVLNPFQNIKNISDDDYANDPGLKKIRSIINRHDSQYKRPIYTYTGGAHSSINLYQQIEHLDLENSDKIDNYIPDVDKYKNLATKLKMVIKNIVSDQEYIETIDNIFKQEFEVISFQTFLYFNSPNGQISDASHLTMEPSSIMYMPNFLSTAFSVFESYDDFISPIKVIYKIKIDNKPGTVKNWVFVDTYSQISYEREIMIQAGSYFVIENIEYVPVEDNEDYNIKVVTMKLFSNVQDAIKYSNTIAPKNIIKRYIYGFINSTLTGGRIIENNKQPILEIIPTKQDKINKSNQTIDSPVINSQTIVISADYIAKRKIKNYDDIISCYSQYYPLFRDFLDKQLIINKQTLSESKNYAPNKNNNLINTKNYQYKYNKYKTKYDNLKTILNTESGNRNLVY